MICRPRYEVDEGKLWRRRAPVAGVTARVAPDAELPEADGPHDVVVVHQHQLVGLHLGDGVGRGARWKLDPRTTSRATFVLTALQAALRVPPSISDGVGRGGSWTHYRHPHNVCLYSPSPFTF